MPYLKKIKQWLNKKTYISFYDAKNFEKKNYKLFSNLDYLNFSIIFFIISFAFGTFISIVYFRCYIDPEYQEGQNKFILKELYQDLEKIKKKNNQRNNFLISLQNFMNDKDDTNSELFIKNYNVQSFTLPIKNSKIISKFKNSNLNLKVQKNEKIFAIDDGFIILKNINKNNCCIVLQHKNGFVSIYNFFGKFLKKNEESVKIGEEIGVINKNSEMTLEIFDSGKKINPEKFFIQ